ncbi:MAG: efflux RND transporter periplasmic adaptor subunit [Flavobacteriales bacterium]
MHITNLLTNQSKRMKTYLPLTLLILLASCSAGNENKELVKLIEQRDKLKAELVTLNNQIAELDTTSTERLPIVYTVLSENRFFEHYFEVQGSLKSDKNIILTAEMSGIILDIRVKEGQLVQQGETIATIDAAILESNMKELEERIELAKYIFEKQESLYKQGVGTEPEYKQAKSNYEALKKNMESLKTQKGKSYVKAPFTGYVDEVFPTEGEMAGPASPVIRLVNNKEMKVVAQVSEAYIASLNSKNKVNLIFPAIGDTISDIVIKRIGMYVNPTNRTVNVEIPIQKSKETYLPNLIASVHVRDYYDSTAVVLPSNVILEDSKGSTFVFVLNDQNEAAKTEIVVGKSYNGFTEILSGLSSGARVVADGARKLTDGKKVEVRTY